MNSEDNAVGVGSLDVKVLIVEIVEEFYRAKGRGLLLSQLGQALRKQGIDLQEALVGRRLSEFIEAELGAAISLVTSPVDRKVLSAIPLGAKAASAPVQKAAPEASSPAIPRIAPAVWAAFTKPIQPGSERVLDVDRLAFIDLPAAEAAGSAYCIPSSDVVVRKPGCSRADYEREVFGKISAWLGKHGIELERISASALAGRHSNIKMSLYEQFVDRLSEDQRRRVALPLDVIEALSRR
jgi:hypothetical protein